MACEAISKSILPIPEEAAQPGLRHCGKSTHAWKLTWTLILPVAASFQFAGV
jgi:hypothetical protein